MSREGTVLGVWNSPLSTGTPTADGQTLQLFMASAGFTVLRPAGMTDPTGGMIYAQDPTFTDCAPVLRQGRFLQWCYFNEGTHDNGKTFFINLTQLMRSY